MDRIFNYRFRVGLLGIEKFLVGNVVPLSGSNATWILISQASEFQVLDGLLGIVQIDEFVTSENLSSSVAQAEMSP